MFAPRYFAPRAFTPRFFPPGFTVIQVQDQPSSRRLKRKAVSAELLPVHASLTIQLPGMQAWGYVSVNDDEIAAMILEAL